MSKKSFSELIYIAFGTNLGEKLTNIECAIELMKKRGVHVIRISPIYQSNPVGFQSEELFYNGVVECDFEGGPEELLKHLKEIERTMGRKAKTTDGYESRIIDLDIILYKDQILNNVKDLQIPHIEMTKRDFVLYPLYQLVNEHVFTSVGKSVKLLINQLKDDSSLFIVR